MPGKLEGKVALVTGASAGIGEAISFALATNGARVSVTARREDRLKKLVAEIDNDNGIAMPLVLDVTNPEQIEEAVRKTVDRFGRLDFLVNNAGVFHPGTVMDGDPDQWRQMFDVNVMGAMLCTRTALPVMQAQNFGHIVMISSISGRRIPSTRATVYGATKFAINAFTEGVRQEVSPMGIRVTSIMPGMVYTEIWDNITDEGIQNHYKSRLDKMQPLLADDIAAAVLYAVSAPVHVNVNELVVRPVDQVS